MVTSCHTESECGWLQIIVKEKGVFSNVTSPSTKAKLRLLFEVAPLALLVSLHPERKDCVFRRQFDKKPSIILGCPGVSTQFACWH